MMHGNTKHPTKYVLCHGLNDAGLMHCPMRREFIDYNEAVGFGAKHNYSHVAHVSDGKIREFETLRSEER